MEVRQFCLALFNGPRRSIKMQARHGEIPSGAVHLDVPFLPSAGRKAPLNPDVHAAASRAYLGITVETGDDFLGPWVNVTGGLVAASVQIYTGVWAAELKADT